MSVLRIIVNQVAWHVLLVVYSTMFP